MITIKKQGDYYRLKDNHTSTWFTTLDNAKDYIRLHYGSDCQLYYFPLLKFYIVRLCRH